MARAIVVQWKGAESQFGFSKLSRSKLYGSKRRIPVDANGDKCEAASLNVDTGTLLRSGMTAQGYFSSADEWIPNKELVGLDENNKEVQQVPSTLGIAQEATVLDPEEILDLKIDSVYLLDETDADDALLDALKQGTVLGMPFNYRTDYQAEHGCLIANNEGVFLLVGQPAQTEWVSHETLIPVADDNEAAEDDDLDFEMF
jgi:hypothetical protein